MIIVADPDLWEPRMELLNRAALVVTPKRRFVEWANRLPDAGKPLSQDEVHSLRTVYLIAAGNPPPDLQDLIDTYWEEVFEELLNGWTVDESLWPANRTAHMFRDWFAVECIDFVNDADPQEPITADETARTQCGVCGDPLEDTPIGVAVGERVHRLSPAEFAEWERAIEIDEEPPLGAEFVLRCCGTECAERAEDLLERALQEQRHSNSQ